MNPEDSDQVVRLTEEAMVSLSLWVFALGALVILLIILFALTLLTGRHLRWWRKAPFPLEMLAQELLHSLQDGHRRKEVLALGSLVNAAYSESLARRNDFWLTYGQITVTVLLLIVVTVLLLTRTIDPDAGLPILSGIAGFAIAKGSGGGRAAAPQLPQDEQG